jgi:hypothetical protein
LVVVVVVELVQVLLVQLRYQHQHQVNLEEHLVKIVDHEVMLQMHRYFVVFLQLSIKKIILYQNKKRKNNLPLMFVECLL